MAVHTFLCPRCDKGKFRTVPLSDGKAFCPWCGEAVSGGTEEPVFQGAPPAPPPPPPEADPVTQLKRQLDETEGTLRRERDRKQEIKKAVQEEMERLEARFGETKALLEWKEQDHRAAVEEIARLKGELEEERKRAAELLKAREDLAEKETVVRTRDTELESLRKEIRDLKAAADLSRRDAEEVKSHLNIARADAVELRKALAAVQGELEALKPGAVELPELRKALAAGEAERKGLKGREEEFRRALERERTEAAALRVEVQKKDQRLRELQLLIKTLGERLNELARRHNL